MKEDKADAAGSQDCYQLFRPGNAAPTSPSSESEKVRNIYKTPFHPSEVLFLRRDGDEIQRQCCEETTERIHGDGYFQMLHFNVAEGAQPSRQPCLWYPGVRPHRPTQFDEMRQPLCRC